MRIQDSFVIHPEGRRFEIQPKVRPAKNESKSRQDLQLCHRRIFGIG